MDQEKFDQHLMDYLFDELDEVTSAAMKRKIESDADCRELALGLRATLEVAHLPVEQPSDDFEERILAAASLAQEGEPWSRKLLRGLWWAGSHAMRPQLAMAAMLVLVVGSSLLLLRVRSGAVAVSLTKDEGSVAAGPSPEHAPAPATQQDPSLSQSPVGSSDKVTSPEAASATTATAKPRAAASGAPLSEEQLAIIDKEFDAGMASYNSGDHLGAQRQFASIKGTKSPRAGSAALYEARAVRASAGCKAAVPYYNAVRSMGGGMAADATWEQADCHRILGEAAQARTLYLTLEGNKSYSARVAKELESQGETANSGGDGSSSRHQKAAPKPSPPSAPAPSKPNEPNQQRQSQGK
jgi:hypothetical protein